MIHELSSCQATDPHEQINQYEELTVTDSTSTSDLSGGDIQKAQQLTSAYQAIRSEMAKAIVGQEEVLEEL